MFVYRRWQLVGYGIALSAVALIHITLAYGDTRIVTVGGAVTEIVYRLRAGDQLIGMDTSSVYPEAVTALPQVGYQRTLSAEGVLSLNSTLVLLSAEEGPPDAIPDHNLTPRESVCHMLL